MGSHGLLGDATAIPLDMVVVVYSTRANGSFRSAGANQKGNPNQKFGREEKVKSPSPAGGKPCLLV